MYMSILKNKKENSMEYILVFGIMFIIVFLISWRWVEGIDYIQKNHPDYKGNDLFGEFDEDEEEHIL